MRKEIYLIKGLTDETYKDFTNRILSLVRSISEDINTAEVKVSLTNIPPPNLSIIPFKKDKIAAVSVSRSGDGFSKKGIDEKGFSGAFYVDEALPVYYEKNWPDLQATPGVCLLTLFRQKQGIDYDTFIHRWHSSHTPLSLKIHPLWNYNRNVVKERYSANINDWDGIVEEQFKTRAELLNPIKFFGNPFVMFYHMWQVYWDTKSFLDYNTIEPYFATEIHIKSSFN
jgi:hypothetical protein